MPAGAATAISPPLASAARDLPLPAFGDIAVDDTEELVCISGGHSSNGIVVTDFSGRVKRTISTSPAPPAWN